MPNRILKESICTSDEIDKLPWFCEAMFYRLIVNCDDYGRFDGRPAVVKNRLFPLKEKITIDNVCKGIQILSDANLVTIYEHEGKEYLQLNTWENHQKIRAKRSKYPTPENIVSSSEYICRHMSASCEHVQADVVHVQANVPVIQSNPIQSNPNPNQSESNPNPLGGKEKQKRFTPPTVDEVEAYCRERMNTVDAERFIDYYATRGWKVGKDTMKDWKACVRTWERNEQEKFNNEQRAKKKGLPF